MGRFRSGLVICLVVGLLGFSLFAEPAGAVPAATEVFRGPRAELKQHPFQVGGLKLTLDCHHALGLGDLFEVQAENATREYLRMEMGELLLVDALGQQTQLARWTFYNQGIHGEVAHTLPVLPGSRLEETYLADAGKNLKFPVRVYYGPRLLAELGE